MQTKWALVGLVVASFAIAGCGDDTGGAGGGDAGATVTSADSTSTGGSCIEPNEGLGGEDCGSTACEPGSYCDGIICDVGCRATVTCAEGEYCDLSAATENKAGTCRVPTASQRCGASTTSASGGASCQDRCYGKVIECGLPEQAIDPVAGCADICGRTDQEQQDCIVASACEDLEDGQACGVSLISSSDVGEN